MLAAQPPRVQEGFGRDVNGQDGAIPPQYGVMDILLRAEVQGFIIEQAECLEALLPLMRHLRPKRIVRLRLV